MPQGPNDAPRYLYDFSKALAGEVRILLAEVGKLRDERRALQYEIAELMSVKSKHGAGGEYAPDWQPERPEPLLDPAALTPAPVPEPPAPARPAWRVVQKRPLRREKEKAKIDAPPAVPAAAPATPLIAPMPAWAQWRPNPSVLSPDIPEPNPSPPVHAGLFGPPTPPPN